MTDFLWNPNNEDIIAKYVKSADIVPGIHSKINPNEICAYREGGIIVGCYTEVSPLLRPKPGILGRLTGRKAPDRDHLFASKGPHEIILDMNANWLTGESAGITAVMKAILHEDTSGKMFTIAENLGIVRSKDIANSIRSGLEGRFSEYVIGLSNIPSTEQELRSHEAKFQQLAEIELSEFGLTLKDAVLRYPLSRGQTAEELQAKVDHDAEMNAIRREEANVRDKHVFAAGNQDIGREMGIGALDHASSDEESMTASIRRISRKLLDAQERQKKDEIELFEMQNESSTRKEKLRIKIQERKNEILGLKELQELTMKDSDVDEEI